LHILRRLGVILAAGALALSLVGVVAPVMAPAAADAAGQVTCSGSGIPSPRNNGFFTYPTGGFNSVDATKADIDTTGVWACDGHATSVDGMFLWVGLTQYCGGGTPNCGGNGADAGVQFGIAACTDQSNAIYNTDTGANLGIHDLCFQHQDTLRYWYAYGGCNGYVPAPRDMKSYDSGVPVPVYGVEHNLSITREPIGGGNTQYHFFIDGTEYLTSVPIYGNNSALSCWGNGAVVGEVSAEIWNESDSFGLTPDNVHMGGVQFSNYGEGTWRNTSWNASGSCEFTANPPAPPSVSQHCDPLSVNSFRAYNTIP
jgi:hypothetical protein